MAVERGPEDGAAAFPDRLDGETPDPRQESIGLVIPQIRFVLRLEHATWKNAFDHARQTRNA
ncbi:MAG: hypothetical protein ACLRG7_12455, partial [Eggerthella lenta]